MSDGNGLRVLGNPEVRNALLLNEIGVLLHDLGKLSGEFIRRGPAFSHHLILRRLTRGKDPYLGAGTSLLSAVRCCLDNLSLTVEERAIAQLLCRELADAGYAASVRGSTSQSAFEGPLGAARSKLAHVHGNSLERVVGLVRDLSANLVWQTGEEESIAAVQPPLIAVQGFHERLDHLPFVADLVEMGGRTWHPTELLPPEVNLLRALHKDEGFLGWPRALGDEEHLADVRQLLCEVLANHFLEIYNIRKDGPGDLGSWFWKAKLCSEDEATVALLHCFDQGATLDDNERKAVRWLGVRRVTQWAYSKVMLGARSDGSEASLWEHTWALSCLHKSAAAQALIEEEWPELGQLAWRILRVKLTRPAAEPLRAIKELVEVEYPLGNEVYRDETSIHFSFPGLKGELAAEVVEALSREVMVAVGRRLGPQLSLSPLEERGLGIPLRQTAGPRHG